MTEVKIKGTDALSFFNESTIMEEKLELISKQLSKLTEAVIGDPTDETKPGLIIRLDRVERSYESLKKGMVVLGTGLLSVAATVGAALILRAI